MTNMYPWIDLTINPVGGECRHNCKYCYMKSKPFSYSEKYKGEPKFYLGAFNKVDNDGSTYFIGSATDIFGEWVPRKMIKNVLHECEKYSKSTFLFQSKNPERFEKFNISTENTILGTTIETNRGDLVKEYTDAPSIQDRFEAMVGLNYRKMVSIEPIMDFDLEVLVNMIPVINPEFVSIGADSKGNNLPEPPLEKVNEFIDRLGAYTTVKEKTNLRKLVK